MWCSRCQQDVPAVATRPDGDARCARCSHALGTGGTSQSPPSAIAGEFAGDSWRRDRWQIDEDLRAAESLIRKVNAIPKPDRTVRAYRVDSPHTPGVQKPLPQRSRPISRWYSGVLLLTGIAGCACGGALLAWSFFGRADLLGAGLACTLAGQATLVLGLLMQLDILWRLYGDAFQTAGGEGPPAATRSRVPNPGMAGNRGPEVQPSPLVAADLDPDLF